MKIVGRGDTKVYYSKCGRLFKENRGNRSARNLSVHAATFSFASIHQYSLGTCYFRGDGVVKNYVDAYRWWLVAAGRGNEDAKHNMTALEDKMTPEQIAEGQKLARGLEPR